MRCALYVVVLLTGGILLGGCGQKGPLFIPSDDQPPAQYQPTRANPPAAPHSN
jgi:predicted small lipoprotein YifL